MEYQLKSCGIIVKIEKKVKLGKCDKCEDKCSYVYYPTLYKKEFEEQEKVLTK